MDALFGGILGGFLRLAPEFFKWLDRRSERGHELAMQDKALEFEKLRGGQRMDEIRAESQGEWNTGALDALTASVKAQSVKSGVMWADALNSAIRPILALWWGIVLYTAVMIARYVIITSSGDVGTAEALVLLWGPEESAIASGVINFFILNRVFDKVK